MQNIHNTTKKNNNPEYIMYKLPGVLISLLRDDLAEQYVAYEFETTSVCSPDINLPHTQVESAKQ